MCWMSLGKSLEEYRLEEWPNGTALKPPTVGNDKKCPGAVVITRTVISTYAAPVVSENSGTQLKSWPFHVRVTALEAS
jgi:hypothetical protein